MNTQIYHKLDLLNRIYLVNHENVELLEQGPWLKLVTDTNSPLPQASDYYAVTDLHLLLFVLPYSKLNRLFRQLIIEYLGHDLSLKLNAKLLARLQPQLSNVEFERLLNQVPPLLRLDSLSLTEIVMRYPLAQVILVLQQQFFSKLAQQLPQQLAQRFSNLITIDLTPAQLAPFVTDKVMLAQVAQWLPNTYQVISQLLPLSTYE